MGNWYCKNCNSWEESWAEHQSYKKEEEYRRDKRCWKCDKWKLRYTKSQKEQYERTIYQRDLPIGSVYQVKRFSTWWSNNIATAVANYKDYYRVFLLVYVKENDAVKIFPEKYDCSYWGDSSRGRKAHNYNSLSDAKSEASWLRGELSSSYGKYYDNPILLIHPYCDCSRSFSEFVKEPYVIKRYSTSNLKPLDIVKTYTTRYGFDFYHVGVYLGKIDGESKVCHFTRDKNDTTIDRWSYFKEGEVIGYHPVIPFKNYKDIIGQAVWAKDNDFRKNNYDLHRRNCEHLANMLVYGINFSEQIEMNKGKLSGAAVGVAAVGGVSGGLGIFNLVSSIAFAPATGGVSLLWGAVSTGAAGVGVAATVGACEDIDDEKANDGKTNINLRDEIRNTDNRLGRKSDYETEKYEEQYLQEVPPKESCRIT